ncbi:transmembrane domain-containing protein [Paenibacillus sp. BSR1-1]|uniref:EGFR-like transmembrane domain-containing protein n=1 Tax=Paenibacillus sp. BSR1-1 TaxID=3020845 RepID=UPI0025B23EAD|nr:transmembrane domain-containing protein [Paenibacillus sp. BSR1-1]MDN3018796.1 transmembrane domain-containing protein [Paenibacillus sp. BSR1-1]
MKKFSVLFFIMAIILNSFSITGAHAYSYGDPNEEKVAEVYKEMVVKLDENPPNFTSAKKLFETVKEEIDMHMGPEPAKLIIGNLDAKDKEAAISNMEKLLVLNIARRLESIESNFKEYDTTKRLLAKGFATYDALSPKVEAENPENDKKIRADFDQSLEALGNPGLFGVGKKEANLDAFKENKDEILNSLKTEFKLKSLEVGHFAESATEQAAAKKDWTDPSNIRNWIPLVLIVAVLIAVIIFVIRRRRK